MTYRFIRGEESNPDKETVIEPAVPQILAMNAKLVVEPVTLPIEAYYPEIRSYVHKDLLAEARTKIQESQKELEKSLAERETTENPTLGSDALELARKDLAAAETHLPALEARIEADKAKHGGVPAADFDTLAERARKLERQASIARADADLLRARKQLAEALSKAKPGDAADENSLAMPARK